jgi:PAS domain S-box-containing protein
MVTGFQDLPEGILATPELQALLLQLPTAVIVAEAPSGRIVAANGEADRIWGGALPRPDTIAEYSLHFTGYRPNGRQYGSAEWPLARAILDGEIVTGEEIEFRLASGARRVLEVSAAPGRDESGEIRAGVAIFRDVTEQRQEGRRRDFLVGLTDEMRGIDDPIAIMEIAASATGEELGVSSASYADIDASGRLALVHAHYRNGRITRSSRYPLEDLGAPLARRLVDGQTVAIEDVATDPSVMTDVFTRWESRSAILAPLIRRGRMTALFSALHDAPRPWTRSDVALVEHVAERACHAVETVRVEADLRQSREWLTLALQAGSAAIWEWDLRTGQIYWSEEHSGVIGVTPSRRALTINRWLSLVHPDDQATARAAAERVAQMKEGEVEQEYRLAGRGRWITIRGRIIADASGQPRRVVGVAVDTTERKAAELEREKLLREAREASEAKSHFIGVISHEFRTPLTAIIGYADLLSTRVSGTLTTTQERQLDRIRASAWHLTQMVDEILTFSRLEGGREMLLPAPTDVPSLVRETVALMAPGAAAKGLALACELPGQPITLLTDGVKLRQILLNLVGNAVKFTERGGITLQVLLRGDRVDFVVRDTGIGISPPDLPHIFERFWQAQQGPTRVVSGAGLGLTVSRQLTSLLSGDLTVTSEVGVGSTFTLSLPVTR